MDKGLTKIVRCALAYTCFIFYLDSIWIVNMCVLRYPPGASRVSPESGDGAGDPGAVGDQSQRTEDGSPYSVDGPPRGEPEAVVCESSILRVLTHSQSFTAPTNTHHVLSGYNRKNTLQFVGTDISYIEYIKFTYRSHVYDWKCH